MAKPALGRLAVASDVARADAAAGYEKTSKTPENARVAHAQATYNISMEKCVRGVVTLPNSRRTSASFWAWPSSPRNPESRRCARSGRT